MLKPQHKALHFIKPYLDGSDGEGDLPPTIDVRVENTKNVLELLRDDKRLKTEDFRTLGGQESQVQTLFIFKYVLEMLDQY